MKIIHEILQSDPFIQDPPVLIDIGASEEINPEWKTIAPYSICVAFDADDRDFQIAEHENKIYRKLFTFNRIVTAEKVENPSFFLTSSPYCSSLLEPDNESLKPWLFSPLFKIDKEIRLQAITLAEAFAQINIGYVDWFKTDSQGTDLRLFKSIPAHISESVLAAQFEPGIINAYKGEDKLYSILKEMDRPDFWLSYLDVRGTQRLNHGYEKQISRYVNKGIIRKSPGWAEIIFLRQPVKNKRKLLLLYILALLQKQYGYALEVADFGITELRDEVFQECKVAVLKKIRAEKAKLPLIIGKRKFNKLFSNIND
jgi:hypothetical protein